MVKAGVPYLISMPNNPQYGEEWSISGNVMFSGRNVVINEMEYMKKESVIIQDGTIFHSLFTIPDEDVAMFGLNAGRTDIPADGSEEGDLIQDGFYRSGSVFHSSVMPKPFEAYLTSEVAESFIPIWGGISGVDTPEISTRRKAVVYNTQGVAVRTVELGGDMLPDLDGLVPGIYIIEGRKFVHHQ